MPTLPSAGTQAVGQYPCGPGHSFVPGPVPRRTLPDIGALLPRRREEPGWWFHWLRWRSSWLQEVPSESPSCCETRTTRVAWATVGCGRAHGLKATRRCGIWNPQAMTRPRPSGSWMTNSFT